MKDVMLRNPLTITGTPTLVAGALSVDTNQALQFNGSTNSGSIADSASLSITGSLAIEFFIKITANPGVTRDIIAKASSYLVQVNSTGKIIFQCINGGNSVSLTSIASLPLNVWNHVVCVLNQEYDGAETFGKTTGETTYVILDDDNGNNKFVSKYTLQESAILRNVLLQVEYFDEIWPVDFRGVVYADNGAGAPGALVTQSPSTYSFTEATDDGLGWRDGVFRSFAVTPALVTAGDYHIGGIADTQMGGGPPKAPTRISCLTTGGTTSRRPDSVSGASDPFGTVSSATAHQLAAYCEYDSVGRTGQEGKASIYLNGALDSSSSSYAFGIADNANAISIAPSLACSLDEISIWNRILSSVEIANHYLSK